MGESLSAFALLCGVHKIAQELWVGLDLPSVIVLSIDEVPGVAIILYELV